ncbi:hypothetical protein EON76_05185 [bacterium]|nr:MAG: hypothetical protein EON76_05185 [bacterium]
MLRAFRYGYDTAQIANLSGLPEPTVYNQLNEQREAERLKAPKSRRCPNEDWNTSEPYYPKLIPYAGKEE